MSSRKSQNDSSRKMKAFAAVKVCKLSTSIFCGFALIEGTVGIWANLWQKISSVPPATDQPRKERNEKKSNFTHHLVNVAVSWHALPFNAHRVGLPSCCLQLFQLGQSGVPRTGCRSAVPLSKSLPKGGNEKKKRRNGYNKNCSSPRLLLGRRLARPSSSSFLFARLRTCVCG